MQHNFIQLSSLRTCVIFGQEIKKHRSIRHPKIYFRQRFLISFRIYWDIICSAGFCDACLQWHAFSQYFTSFFLRMLAKFNNGCMLGCLIPVQLSIFRMSSALPPNTSPKQLDCWASTHLVDLTECCTHRLFWHRYTRFSCKPSVNR